jgi:guanylate kinase
MPDVLRQLPLLPARVHRLRGRQAYVLDYSDLINPNSVEKPFLKPVIVAGPSARGERRKLLEMLVTEFPDVFDFPRQHTTTRLDEHARHVGAAGDELQQLAVEQQGKGSGAVGAGSAGVSEADSGAAAGDSHDSNDSSAAALGPVPVVLSREAFEAAAAAGRLLEVHTELFKHPLAAQRWGHSAEALQDVIRAGKLPLLELEAEEAELVKVTKGVDCLTVFLAPPSLEEHQQRLADAATESDEEVAQRGAAAAAELGVVQSKRVFDAVLHNDELAQGYRALKAAISRFRPDLIPPDADLNAAARAAQHAAASQPAPVIIAGPAGVQLTAKAEGGGSGEVKCRDAGSDGRSHTAALSALANHAGGGRERLVQQLQARFPQRFAAPRRLTDRKPGKADKEPATDEFVKPDVLARLAAQGQVVWSQPDTAAGGGSSLAVTVEGLQEVTGAGESYEVDRARLSGLFSMCLPPPPCLPHQARWQCWMSAV